MGLGLDRQSHLGHSADSPSHVHLVTEALQQRCLFWVGVGWCCGCVLPVPQPWLGRSWDAQGSATAGLLAGFPAVSGRRSCRQRLEQLVAAGLPAVVGKQHP